MLALPPAPDDPLETSPELDVVALELPPAAAFRLAEGSGHEPRTGEAPPPAPPPLPDDAIRLDGRTFDEIQREIFTWALRRHNGSRRGAARALHVARSTFCEKVKRYGL